VLRARVAFRIAEAASAAVRTKPSVSSKHLRVSHRSRGDRSRGEAAANWIRNIPQQTLNHKLCGAMQGPHVLVRQRRSDQHKFAHACVSAEPPECQGCKREELQLAGVLRAERENCTREIASHVATPSSTRTIQYEYGWHASLSKAAATKAREFVIPPRLAVSRAYPATEGQLPVRPDCQRLLSASCRQAAERKGSAAVHVAPSQRYQGPVSRPAAVIGVVTTTRVQWLASVKEACVAKTGCYTRLTAISLCDADSQTSS